MGTLSLCGIEGALEQNKLNESSENEIRPLTGRRRAFGISSSTAAAKTQEKLSGLQLFDLSQLRESFNSTLRYIFFLSVKE